MMTTVAVIRLSGITLKEFGLARSSLHHNAVLHCVATWQILPIAGNEQRQARKGF